MAYCPSCGCRTAEAARFCPMCGVVINKEAVAARLGSEEKAHRRAEVPQPNEPLIEGYTTPNTCGTGTARAMRILAVLLTIVLAVLSVVAGIIQIRGGLVTGGIVVMLAGLIGSLLLFFFMHIGIMLFENISTIARGVETQHRITTAQLELLSSMVLQQDESLRLNRQSVELLKVMDGDRFDAAKQAECQTALLDKLTEQQREQEKRLSELKSGSDAMMQLARPLAQSLQSWKTESHRFIHGVALALSQLPDRLRDAIGGSQKQGTDLLNAAQSAPEVIPELLVEPEETSANND